MNDDPNREAVRWLSESEQRVWRAWIDVTSRLDHRIEGDLRADAGLGGDDYEVLVALSEAPERRQRMSELADRVHNSPSRLSQRIDRMVAKGLVERQRCDNDKRGQFAVLTPFGMSQLEGAAPGHVRSVRHHFIDPLSADELATLGELLERLAEALDGTRSHDTSPGSAGGERGATR